MADRITRSMLDRTAELLTRAARELKLIERTECVRVGGAYGGWRFEISGDWEALAKKYGSDRDTWPAGWSGVRFGFLYSEGYEPARVAWDLGNAALRVMWEVLDKRKR